MPTTVTTKNQLEQLNTMRESLFSQDGWGCQHVNQDTNWDVPGSPDASGGASVLMKSDGTNQTLPGASNPNSTSWKQTVNNGTELWEANLRNDGQPVSDPLAKKNPWSHKPSNNLGGTWGEDDDGIEATNVWTGSTNQQWPQTNVNNAGLPPSNNSNNASSSNMWSAQATNNSAGGSNILANNAHGNAAHNTVPNASMKKEGEWTNNPINPVNTNWVDPREIRPSNSSIDARNNEQRELRLADPREQLREMREMRGDPRGISGMIFFPTFLPMETFSCKFVQIHVCLN